MQRMTDAIQAPKDDKNRLIIGVGQFKIYLWIQRIITGYNTDCIFYEMKSEIKILTTLIGRVYEWIKK